MPQDQSDTTFQQSEYISYKMHASPIQCVFKKQK